MAGLAPPLTDERELLLAYLAQQREGLRNASHGLSDEQAKRALLASALSVGGLVKHLANTETGWIDMVVQRDSGTPAVQEADYGASFRLDEGESLADVLKGYEDVARHTHAVILGIADLNEAVPVPRGAPWFPADVEAWSVRWVLLHLIEETARHAGHADIIRESIDGATMYALMAAVEGWPDTDWLKAWKPAR